MAKINLKDALSQSLETAKLYIDTELAKKADSNHGTHVTYATSAPKANGTAAVGTVNRVAREDHVHPLQTTVSGNAGTATKLATARKINGTSFNGSADITTANWGTARKINQISVNGSADVKLPLDYYTCNIGSSNAKPYHHILTTGQCTGNYTDKSITIVLVNHYNSAGLGIAKATLRTNDAANGATATGELRWLVRSGFSENQLCFNIRNTAKDTYMDVFYKSAGTYNSLTWYVLTEGARGSHGSQWTKYNTHHDNGTNVYDETGMKAIRTYTATLQSAVDHGAVNSAKTAATCSGNAATATKLATARSIGLGGILSGSANFDGSANITISASIAKPPKSGNWWSGGMPVVNTDGVMEVGKYIDFHHTDASTNDFDTRLQTGTSGPVTITLPSSNGTLALTGHTHSYLPLSGGTMTGDLKFTDVTSTTYPAVSKKIVWNGSTDGVDLYYQVDASDKGRLMLNTRDDADCVIAFANKGTIKSTIDNNGNFSGKAANSDKVGGYSVWVGTQAQYNAISSKSSTTIYYITG